MRATSYPAIVGALLERARKVAGLSQRRLAEAVGVNQPTLSQIENGRVPPRVDQVARWAEAARTSSGVIFSQADQVAATALQRGIEVVLDRHPEGGPPGVVEGAELRALLEEVLG